jgi:F-type H+/Na+-transporting ATPase subunit alpha
VDKIRDFEAQLLKYIETSNPRLLQTIMEKKQIDDALKADLGKTVTEFKQTFAASMQPAGAAKA